MAGTDRSDQEGARAGGVSTHFLVQEDGRTWASMRYVEELRKQTRKKVAEEIAEAAELEADDLDMPTTVEWLELRDWFKDRLHMVAAKAREVGNR